MSKRCGDGAVAMIAIQKCFSFYQQLPYFEHATPPVTVLKRLSNNSESSGTGLLHRGIHYPTVAGYANRPRLAYHDVYDSRTVSRGKKHGFYTDFYSHDNSLRSGPAHLPGSGFDWLTKRLVGV